MKNLHTFEEFVNESLNEGKKQKFLLYTNPNNSTNRAYVAIGAADVREVLSDAKRYSDSYRILYQGNGTQDDLVKAKRMFTDYQFGNESIDESLNEGDMTRDYDGFIVSDTDSKKNLHWKFRYMKGIRNNKVEDIAIAKVMKETGKSRADYWVTDLIKKGEWNKSEAEEI